MEQCAGCRDVLSAISVGKETIVADAVSVIIVFYFVPGCVKIPMKSDS
jgi:hypothetical protein